MIILKVKKQVFGKTTKWGRRIKLTPPSPAFLEINWSLKLSLDIFAIFSYTIKSYTYMHISCILIPVRVSQTIPCGFQEVRDIWREINRPTFIMRICCLTVNMSRIFRLGVAPFDVNTTTLSPILSIIEMASMVHGNN